MRFLGTLVFAVSVCFASLLDPLLIPKFVRDVPMLDRLSCETDGSFVVAVKKGKQQILPEGFNETEVFLVGNEESGFWSPGPKIVSTAEVTLIKYRNMIYGCHILHSSIDWSIPCANPSGDNSSDPVPLSFHLHGGEVDSIYDGGPDSWFTQNLTHVGQTFLSESFYKYPIQNAAILFAHDHTMGISRLNVYAGVIFPFIVSSDLEVLLIADKSFNEDGSLFYPSKGSFPRHPIWTSSYFGSVILVNGVSWPRMNVSSGKTSRFAIINGCNDRTLILAFECSNGTKIPFQIIGSDAGYLESLVVVEKIVLMPSERVQILLPIPSSTDWIVLRNFGPDEPFVQNSSQTPSNELTTGLVLKFLINCDGSNYTHHNFSSSPIGQGSIISRTRTFSLAVKMVGQSFDSFIITPPEDTIIVEQGSTEDWIFNNTGRLTHPMHIHSGSFKIIGRLAPGADVWQEPLPEERGLKDTVQCPIGLTKVRMTFKKLSTKAIPFFLHCHMLSHEDNMMMIPFFVVKTDQTYLVYILTPTLVIVLISIVTLTIVFLKYFRRKSYTKI